MEKEKGLSLLENKPAIAVIIPMVEEAQSIIKTIAEDSNFEPLGSTDDPRVSHLSYLGFRHKPSDQELIISTVGVGGKSKPAIFTTTLLLRWASISRVLVTGIAASVGELKPGDVFFPDDVYAYRKFLISDPGKVPVQNMARLTGFEVNGIHEMRSDIYQVNQSVFGLVELPDGSRKGLVTMPAYLHSSEFIRKYREFYPQIEAIDMETHDIVEAASRIGGEGIELSVLRVISDTAGRSGEDELTRNIGETLNVLGSNVKKTLVHLAGKLVN